MSERGPVGGAGELNIELFKKELEKIEWTAEGHCAGADTGSYTAKLWPWLTKQIINAALAAKAPQGVPDALSLAVAIANTLMSQNMLDVTVQQAMFPIKRVLEGALPGPVSDDTIHHGMVPPERCNKLMATTGRRCQKNTGHVKGCQWTKAQEDRDREAAAPKPAPARPTGWLQNVLADASKRVEDWPEWKKDIELAPAPPISEFTPENMPVVTVAGGAPPNASPPSWRRSLAEKAKDEMSEFEKGFPYDAATPAPGAERAAPTWHDLPERERFEKWWIEETTSDICGLDNLGLDQMACIARFAKRLWREALAAAPPAPITSVEAAPHVHLLIHQLTKVTLELEDTLASLGKADSMITKLKDLIAERDRHASAERVRELVVKWRADAVKYQGGLRSPAAKVYLMCADALERALPPSTGEKPQ